MARTLAPSLALLAAGVLSTAWAADAKQLDTKKADAFAKFLEALGTEGYDAAKRPPSLGLELDVAHLDSGESAAVAACGLSSAELARIGNRVLSIVIAHEATPAHLSRWERLASDAEKRAPAIEHERLQVELGARDETIHALYGCRRAVHDREFELLMADGEYTLADIGLPPPFLAPGASSEDTDRYEKAKAEYDRKRKATEERLPKLKAKVAECRKACDAARAELAQGLDLARAATSEDARKWTQLGDDEREAERAARLARRLVERARAASLDSFSQDDRFTVKVRLKRLHKALAALGSPIALDD